MMLVVSVAVAFCSDEQVVREAHEIQPLVPAPTAGGRSRIRANFIGYGTFALSAMVAFAYLISSRRRRRAGTWRRCGCWGGAVLRAHRLRQGATAEAGSSCTGWVLLCLALIVAGILLGRRRIAEGLPALQVLDDGCTSPIAVGFALHHRHRAWARSGRPRPGAATEHPEGDLGADRLVQLRRFGCTCA